MVSFEKVVHKFQKLDEFLKILAKISKTPIDNKNVYEYIKGNLKDIEEFKSVIIKRYKT